jgi:subtilisin family serine protease
VTIGIMDSGVDETHPDIAPNYNEGLSRNFTVQDLDSDVPNPHWHNPCPADGCLADAGAAPDEAHGTSVAGVAAAAANGIGVSGVAPDASIVSLRVFAGDEDGMDLLWPVNALTYAGARGINVVNMSFMVRQWLDSYSHPASTWTPGRELSAIAVNRALEYAHARGVTLVAAAGNELADFSEALPPLSVPLSLAGKGNNLAGGLSQLSLPHPVVLPAQGAYVIGAIAVGPGGEKATYSNYGSQFESARLIAAPGGDADAVDPAVGQDTGEILSAVPGGRWEYAQGTSLAAPQIAGSAALVIAKFGTQDPANPERTTMPPDLVWEAIRDGATPTPCPPPRPPNFTYKGKLIPPQQCIGPPGNNSFYGSGTVNVPRSLSNRPGMTAQ